MHALASDTLLDLGGSGRLTPWGFPSPTGPTDLTEATNLTPLDYFAAAQWTYHHCSQTPPDPFSKTILASSFDPAAGFYGAALKVNNPPGAADQIVVAFEGTDPSSETLHKDPVFLAGQIEADTQIYFGQIPKAFTDALAFTTGVLAMAGAEGIPTENVTVTGHSLGGAEAEYVASQLGLGGDTFGAPGIRSATVPDGSSPVLTNYVVYGDPVGNYSSDSGRLSNILFSADINHFGEVQSIGSFLGGLQLDAANVLLAPDRTDSEKLEGFGLLVDAVKYHLTPSYEEALKNLPSDDILVGGSFANPHVNQTLDLWA
jgi:hypothetical protein